MSAANTQVDDVATVIGTGPDDLLMEAAEICPIGAIRIVDSASGRREFP